MLSIEIVLPYTKPETEWVRGRALVKHGQNRRHAITQAALAAALHDWAHHRGELGAGWRFRLQPPDDVRRPLVPDLAFVDNKTLRRASDGDLELRPFPPTIAIEVLCPEDAPEDIAEKIDVYLRSGSRLVLIVDPDARTMRLHDFAGVRELGSGETLRHPALRGFTLSIGGFFSRALDRMR